jgi:hypothetical protein
MQSVIFITTVHYCIAYFIILSVILLSDIMLGVIMLRDVMLSVIMLSDVMLSFAMLSVLCQVLLSLVLSC